MTDENETLRAHIEWRAVEMLGDRVSRLQVVFTDCDARIGIGIKTPQGWRHAVSGWTVEAAENPGDWTTRACQALDAWIIARRMVHCVA